MTTGTGTSILVTGGSSFVGAQLARTFAARRYHVRVLTRTPERASDLRSAGIEVCQGDLRNPASLESACEGVRLVFNTACIRARRGVSLADCLAVNATAVGALIEAAASRGVRRVVHLSTTDVHGDPEALPANEDAARNPRSASDATRLDGERIAGEAASRSGIELVVARPATVYGPGDCRLVWFFRSVIRRRFVLLGTGDVFVHLAYVDDLAEGLRLCGESSQASGRTYILAGPEIVRVGDLASLISREAGVKPLITRLPARPIYAAAGLWESVGARLRIGPSSERERLGFVTVSRAYDISRARAELGYAPKVDVREGVRRCLEWYRGKDLL